MHFFHSKPGFLVVIIVLALLNACSTGNYYAPVKTDNNGSAENKQNPLIGNPPLNKVNPAVTGDMRTQPSASKRRTFKPIDSSSGHGYQRLSPSDQKSPAHNRAAEIKIKRSDTEEKNTAKKNHNTVGKSTNTRQPKTINSASHKSNSEAGSAHDKQPAKLDAGRQSKNERKKSIASIDNKKMLELRFGWPIRGRVLKGFSASHNKGIDIAGKNEQPVKAAEAGKIVYGGQGLIGFGKLLIIKHNDVYLSAYANSSRLMVNEGQYVKKGQVVAQVGDVGIKQTSLHFEIRENGKPVNPLKFLPKK